VSANPEGAKHYKGIIEMKVGFCTNVFSDEELWPALAALREMGYDGVELWDSHLKNADLAQLGEYLAGLGLEVMQICPYFNVTGTQDELTTTIETAREYINIAKKLSCKHIRVFTGSVSSRDATPPIYRQAVKALQEMCAMNRSEGLFLVLETHEGSLMDTGPATLRLLQDVDAGNLKVNLQIPLDGGREDVYQSVALLGKHTIHIHAHNWIGSWPNFTFLEAGDYSFKQFLLALREQGFDGTDSVEHGYHSGFSPLEIARREVAYLKQFKIPCHTAQE